MKDHLFDNLKTIREMHNLTQKEIAVEVGVTRECIASYESGKNAPPVDVLLLLARFYSISLETLLGIAIDSGGESALSLSEPELDLLRIFRSMPPDKQKKLIKITEILAADN